jgi:hypothetical protein
MHKRKRSGDGSINFPDLQCWNPETRVITFVAELDGERIDCKIKASDLLKKFPTSPKAPMQSVVLHKAILEDIAVSKIKEQLFDTNGSVNISYNDLI